MYSCPVDLAKWQFCAIKQIYDFQERHIQTISHIKYITQIQKPKNILSWSSRLNIWPTDWLTKPQKKPIEQNVSSSQTFTVSWVCPVEDLIKDHIFLFTSIIYKFAYMLKFIKI